MLLAIVPAYNEEKTIGHVLRGIIEHTDAVLVVDDGSTDETASHARLAGALVISHEINRGQGAALETGHEYARRIGADYVLHFDADGQFDPLDIRPALQALQKENVDVLFGSRFLDTRSEVPFLKRSFLLPVGRLVNRVFGTMQLSDAHNGFRILSYRAVRSIHITHDRMAHATEIPKEVHRLRLPFIEFPVKVMYREYGQGMSGGLAVVRDLLFAPFVK